MISASCLPDLNHRYAKRISPAGISSKTFRGDSLAQAQPAGPRGTFADPRRRLAEQDYLSLLLFGLFNPVVTSMGGLCAASRLHRVQQEICTRPVSLASFSEAQQVVDPELLQKVFHELASQQQQQRAANPADPRLARYRDQLLGIDSTLLRWQHGR